VVQGGCERTEMWVVGSIYCQVSAWYGFSGRGPELSDRRGLCNRHVLFVGLAQIACVHCLLGVISTQVLSAQKVTRRTQVHTNRNFSCSTWLYAVYIWPWPTLHIHCVHTDLVGLTY
jgi:hypothetical protein